ncbi:hypothetical protein PG996_004700 [Apiospora saccharicola]|uniref:Uncharacterized protein n=1 Tax=Apiospora saccharicola TaxID=335842 RepID=A0ABR1W7P5_9PEZI
MNVGRVVDAGRLIGLYDLKEVRRAESFIVYDGPDVLARVQTNEMRNAVYELAVHHIGRRLGWSHPADEILDITSYQMDDKLGDGYAVKMSFEDPVGRNRCA